jgi:hypothetical protein
MKTFIILPFVFLVSLLKSFGQSSALNIPGIHQLVSYSKSENGLQKDARTKQVQVSANEEGNKTLLAKLKVTYRTLQQRYNTLGTAINAANIGLNAVPMVNRIVSNQQELYELAKGNPAIAALAYNTEIAFVDKAHSLVNYLIGLSASIGDINQMKLSDRRIIFDFILTELSAIQDLSGNLVNSVRYVNRTSLIRSLNPMQDYIDQDKALADEIIRNAKYLKQ